MSNFTLSASYPADGATVVNVRGEIDASVSNELLNALVAEVTRRRPPRLVVDMLHVTFLDSAGLNALLAARRAAQRLGTSFMVRQPSEFVSRQMRVTGIYDILTAGQ